MTGRKKNKEKSAILREKKLVDNALRKYLSALKGPRKILEAVRYVVLSGGKRLRPILLLEASKALKGSRKDALPFASAVELAHNFSLAHDDLPAMDDDDTRRGKPACHKKFTEGIAILAGDALLNLAFGIMAGVKHKRSKEMISALSEAIGTESMIGGQALDLERAKGKINNRRLRRKIDGMKTASLMASSCAIGAMVATPKTKDINRMREFGKNLGLAFQIRDDMRDAKFGKTALRAMENDARLFISKAKRILAPFGKEADVLRYIADAHG